MADGWKWKVRGSRKLLEKEPRYRRSLYFYHGQDGEERTFKRPHLASMIRDSVVTKFPFEQHCYCNGQAGGRMVACDRCDRWYRAACLSRVIVTDEFVCRSCC